MDRRGFVGALVAAPLMAWATKLLARADQAPGLPSPIPNQFPDSQSQNPPGVPPMPGPPVIDPRMVLTSHQEQLKKDVRQLFDLARKLRGQVEKTDSTEVLSLNMLHTAEKIEKLAKHIQDEARS